MAPTDTMKIPSNVPPELIVDFDVNDDSLATDINHCMDGFPEICYSMSNGGHWIVTTHKLITEVFSKPEEYSNLHASLPVDIAGDRPRMIPLEYDPPEHGQYRRLLTSHFTPAKIRTLEDRLRVLCSELIDRFAADGSCEFMSSFARPFPALMFLELMGWPHDHMEDFCGWVDGFLYGEGGDVTDPATLKIRTDAIENIYQFFQGFVDEARRVERDDITGTLLRTPLADGRLLTDEEVLNYIFLLLIAGLHTVEGALAFGAMYFSSHPEMREQMCGDPSLLRKGVDELLRWEPPAWGSIRVVTRDHDFHGMKLLAGDVIMVPHQAANRDPATYEQPQVFDPTRSPNPHVSFGFGIHTCLGIHLARLELQIAFEQLYARIPDYKVDQSRPPVQHVAQVRGVESLYLNFTPSR